MKIESLKKAVRPILIVAVVGFALTALAGCGIGHGPYRHGYDGQKYYKNADHYRSGYSDSGHDSTSRKYNHNHRGDGYMMGYGLGRSGYCGQ